MSITTTKLDEKLSVTGQIEIGDLAEIAVAAARKQIVIVAENLLATKEGRELPDVYDGYGACPITMENGKVILAEFGFGGKLLPIFPLNPAVPRRFSWLLKARLFPWLYWDGMLRGAVNGLLAPRV